MKKNIRLPFLLFLIIFILWSFYRYFFKYPEWIDEFLAKPLLMLLPAFILVRLIENRSFSSIGLSSKGFIKNLLIGFLAGVFISLEAIVTNNFKNGSVIFNPNHLSGLPLLITILIPFATGFSEEVVFRGYMFNRFFSYLKSEFAANLLSTLLFVTLHLPVLLFVQHIYSFNLFMSLLQLFILGTLNGIIFARTKTVTASTLTHALWNLSTVMFR